MPFSPRKFHPSKIILMIRISLTEESAFHRYLAAGFSLALFATRHGFNRAIRAFAVLFRRWGLQPSRPTSLNAGFSP